MIRERHLCNQHSALRESERISGSYALGVRAASGKRGGEAAVVCCHFTATVAA
jgi:hypothetical protein